ncbi:hypothetical protein AM592_00145 [Bacillus gobiensis]|uniref:Uncharacterized protein n=1 Tax=Bacillus gobiensis TaxID=1441095 RepID=A0A0M4FNK1_9BACI|nr:hypothetical protein AM592_00145 [Bacillus gobiensis]
MQNYVHKLIFFRLKNFKLRCRVDLDLKATNLFHDVEESEKCEYVVKVEWLANVSKEEAYWVKGLKANQNRPIN